MRDQLSCRRLAFSFWLTMRDLVCFGMESLASRSFWYRLILPWLAVKPLLKVSWLSLRMSFLREASPALAGKSVTLAVLASPPEKPPVFT